ncbi:MAG: hypothetical protein WC581_07870 [Thermodesulfovibrionales bacterium]
MKFKRNRLFIVLLCLFLSFSGLVFKASGAPGDSCTLNNVCAGCHNEYLLLCGSGGKFLKQVDSYTEKHGLSNADVAVVLNIHKDTPPDLSTRLVLGGALYCTDCHEDHGTSTPNAYLLKNNVNNIPVEVPITRFDSGVCSLPGTAGNKAMGWFCRTCHKDDATITRYPQYKNQWKYAHHYLGGGSDYPYNRTRCYKCHWSAIAEPISCECCHTHGSMTTDYGTSYPCYLDKYICRTPYDRRTF